MDVNANKELGRFVDRLFRIGSVKIDTEVGFLLKAHRHDPTLPLSPIYVEFGNTTQAKPGPLEPRDITAMARLFWSLKLQHLNVDFGSVAGVPHGGTAPAEAVVAAAYHMSGREIDWLVLDKIEKDGYSHVGGVIEGNRYAGTNVVLIEDATSTGRSLEEAAEQLRNEGLKVTDAVAFLDRAQGAQENLRKIGVRLHSVMTIHMLIAMGARQGHLTLQDHIHVGHYLEDDKDRRVRIALAAAS